MSRRRFKYGSRGLIREAATALGRAIEEHSKRHGHARTAALVARWLEFGTSKMAANPFITRGWELTKTEALDKIVEVMKEELIDHP